jgi:hypothetical protein
MKFSFLFTALLLFACSNNNSTASDKATTAANESVSEEKTTATSGEQGNGIVGQWQIKYIATDENGNRQLDENEIKNASTQVNDYYNDYLKFSADGSCLFSKAKSKGKYKIEDESSQSKLYIYDLYNNEAYKYAISSISKDELRLMADPDVSSFVVFKRI